MSVRLLVLALASLVVLPSQAALAYELRPISRDFTPSGSGATQTYEVVNTGKEPIAINVSVVTRVVDSTGAETNQGADDDFLVYPPQFVVPAGARQSLRVSWLGNPVPARELAYRLKVEQLPIERFKEKPNSNAAAAGAITVLKKYLGSLYIRPAKAAANLVIESIRLMPGAPGQRPELVVLMHNKGTARAVLRDRILQVSGRGEKPPVSVAFEALKLKTGIVLPDGRLEVHVPWPQGVEPEAVKLVMRSRN